MSGGTTSGIDPSEDNINKAYGTPGIVGYSNSYISLQAVNGIYLNGVGAGNTAPTSLPEEMANDTMGNFYISGQNGEAVIKSVDNGSIHLDSSGDVTINVPNGTLNTTVKAVTGFVKGDSVTKNRGNITSIIEKSSNTVVLGAYTQTVVGESLQANLGNGTNLNAAGVETINMGEIFDFNFGAAQTINFTEETTITPDGINVAETKTEAMENAIKAVQNAINTVQNEIKTIQNEITTCQNLISNVQTELKTAETKIETTNVKLSDNLVTLEICAEICIFSQG